MRYALNWPSYLSVKIPESPVWIVDALLAGRWTLKELTVKSVVWPSRRITTSADIVHVKDCKPFFQKSHCVVSKNGLVSRLHF